MGIFGLQFPWETPEGVGFIAPWTPKAKVIDDSGAETWIQLAGSPKQVAAGVIASNLEPGEEISASNLLGGPMPGPGRAAVGVGMQGAVWQQVRGEARQLTPTGVVGPKMISPVVAPTLAGVPSGWNAGAAPPEPEAGEETGLLDQLLGGAAGGVAGWAKGGIPGAILGVGAGLLAGGTKWPWQTEAGEGFIAPWTEKALGAEGQWFQTGNGGLAAEAGAWNGATPIRSWTNESASAGPTVEFVQFANGRMASRSLSTGRIKTWMPKKHIVISRNPRISSIRKLDRVHKRVAKQLRAYAPKGSRRVSPMAQYLSPVEKKSIAR